MTTVTTVPLLTTAPNRSQGDTGYSTIADAWAASLATFNVGMNTTIAEINLVSGEINADKVAAGVSASAALVSENNAASSAAAANNTANATPWIIPREVSH